ncbi:MAG: ATP synthase subunit I [Glaciecola sp.]
MDTVLARQGIQLAKKGIYTQIMVGLVICTSTMLLQPTLLVSILLGCLSFIVPHSIFAYWVFRYAGASKNELVAQSFSQGMKIKLILTSIFFIVAFSQLHAHPLPLLGAYATIMVSQWLAMLLLKQN